MCVSIEVIFDHHIYNRGFVISELEEDEMGWDLASIRKNLEFTEKTKGEIKQLFHPYYIVNLVLSSSFLFLKLTHPFCDYLFTPGPVRVDTIMVCSKLIDRSGDVRARHARD